jgi:hypothetical protein
MRRRGTQALSGWIPMAAIKTVSVPEEKPLVIETPEERKQRLWREDCERESKRVQAARAKNLEVERQTRLRQQQEADRKRRESAFTSAEFQITAAFDHYGLTESERSSIEDQITQRKLWATPMVAVEFATVQAMEIAAKVLGGKTS